MALARVKIMMENAPAPGSTAKVDFNTMKAPAGCAAAALMFLLMSTDGPDSLSDAAIEFFQAARLCASHTADMCQGWGAAPAAS